MIYYLSIVLLFFFSLRFIIGVSKFEYKNLLGISFIFFILIGGLRYEVGADWIAYMWFFKSLEIKSFGDFFAYREEPMYVFINYLIKNIYSNFSFFVFALFTISFSIKFYIFKKYSANVFLSLIIYFYTVFIIYEINGLRQGMALALTMFSWMFVIEKKLSKFLLTIFVAFLFHKSALVFLPFYFVANFKMGIKKTWYFLGFMLLITIPFREFFKMSSLYTNLMASEAFEHYSVYGSDDTYKLDIPLYSFSVIQRLIIFGLFLITYDQIKIDKRFKNVLKNGYLAGIVVFLLFSFSSEMAARLGFYYKSFETLIIPLIVTSFYTKDKKIMMLVLFTLFAIIGLERILSIPKGYLIPYQNLIIQ